MSDPSTARDGPRVQDDVRGTTSRNPKITEYMLLVSVGVVEVNLNQQQGTSGREPVKRGSADEGKVGAGEGVAG